MKHDYSRAHPGNFIVVGWFTERETQDASFVLVGNCRRDGAGLYRPCYSH